jgi:hypothetical protein
MPGFGVTERVKVDGKRIAAAAFVDTLSRANVATELVDG